MRRGPSTRSDATDAAELRLAQAAPLTARRVLYAGDNFEGFLAAYGRRNPNAPVQYFAGEAQDDALVDLVVLGPGAPLEDLLASVRLAAGGALAIAGGAHGEKPSAQLAARGFTVVKTRGTETQPVWIAQDAADARHGRLHVEFWAFAPKLLDIRTRLPTTQLDTDPRIVAHFRTAPFNLPDLPDRTPRIVICQRPGAYSLQALRQWLAPTLAAGWLPVLEYDDHPELVAAVTGVASSEQTWNIARGMAAVQVSTEKLAEAFLRHNPEVAVFPNSVFDLPPFPEGDRPRRVFYGAVTRGPFAVEVARSLTPAIRQFPDTEFVVVGDQAVFDALPTRRKRLESYMPYERYLELMRTCTVTLSPLSGGPAHEAKSDAKFLDAAQSGALIIASPLVYADVVRHGENGLIARSREQWAPLLARALRDPGKRREMARRAWQEVRDRRMFADQIGRRRDWYLELWARRDALQREICDRLPGLREAISALR
ncbi:glycosyltransferase [Phenylobacterium sp.]|uniref:glycosyltransferase family protein n=1 Tax=Phenylobacterium sp. TaxID=1871053 RepID=UPI0028127428|nr:glycosyltransferase [Phenylobacterium sp.]